MVEYLQTNEVTLPTCSASSNHKLTKYCAEPRLFWPPKFTRYARELDTPFMNSANACHNLLLRHQRRTWLYASISFIAVDVVYEEMKKRVFLLTMLLALTHIPFILEIIALYPKLGPRTTDNIDIEYTKLSELEHDWF